jgi:hypothetical protein
MQANRASQVAGRPVLSFGTRGIAYSTARSTVIGKVTGSAPSLDSPEISKVL